MTILKPNDPQVRPQKKSRSQNKWRTIKNQKGQSLIEYLLLVALMAVGTIGVLRVLNKTVQVNFANITATLQGQTRAAEHERVEASDHKKKDMGDFMSGAVAPR